MKYNNIMYEVDKRRKMIRCKNLKSIYEHNFTMTIADNLEFLGYPIQSPPKILKLKLLTYIFDAKLK